MLVWLPTGYMVSVRATRPSLSLWIIHSPLCGYSDAGPSPESEEQRYHISLTQAALTENGLYSDSFVGCLRPYIIFKNPTPLIWHYYYMYITCNTGHVHLQTCTCKQSKAWQSKWKHSRQTANFKEKKLNFPERIRTHDLWLT